MYFLAFRDFLRAFRVFILSCADMMFLTFGIQQQLSLKMFSLNILCYGWSFGKHSLTFYSTVYILYVPIS